MLVPSPFFDLIIVFIIVCFLYGTMLNIKEDRLVRLDAKELLGYYLLAELTFIYSFGVKPVSFLKVV